MKNRCAPSHRHPSPITSLFSQRTNFFFFTNLFIYLLSYLFWAALGLRCCTWAFSSCGERGLLFFAVRGILIVVASLVEHGLQARGLSSCGSRALERRLSSCRAWAQLLHSMWDLPRPGIEPTSPALAGGFLTTAPPGKSPKGPIVNNCLYILPEKGMYPQTPAYICVCVCVCI